MARVYDTKRWLRLRRHKLQQNPLCGMCLKQGRLEVATVVDHIVGINKGGPAYPALDGLMSCCEACHNRKTRIVEQQGKELTPKTVRGCDVDGRPLR